MRNVEGNSPVQARVVQRMSRIQTRERARQTQQADPQDTSGYGARIVSRPKRSQASKHGPSDIYPTVIYDRGICIEIWCAICGANATGSSAPHACFAGFKGVKQHILRAPRPEGAPKPSDKVIWDCVYTRTVSAEDEELMRAGETPIISIEMATRGEVAVDLIEQYLVAPECTAEDTTLGDTTLAVGDETDMPDKTMALDMLTIDEEPAIGVDTTAVADRQNTRTADASIAGDEATTSSEATSNYASSDTGNSAATDDTIQVSDVRRMRSRASIFTYERIQEAASGLWRPRRA